MVEEWIDSATSRSRPLPSRDRKGAVFNHHPATYTRARSIPIFFISSA